MWWGGGSNRKVRTGGRSCDEVGAATERSGQVVGHVMRWRQQHKGQMRWQVMWWGGGSNRKVRIGGRSCDEVEAATERSEEVIGQVMRWRQQQKGQKRWQVMWWGGGSNRKVRRGDRSCDEVEAATERSEEVTGHVMRWRQQQKGQKRQQVTWWGGGSNRKVRWGDEPLLFPQQPTPTADNHPLLSPPPHHTHTQSVPPPPYPHPNTNMQSAYSASLPCTCHFPVCWTGSSSRRPLTKYHRRFCTEDDSCTSCKDKAKRVRQSLHDISRPRSHLVPKQHNHINEISFSFTFPF